MFDNLRDIFKKYLNKRLPYDFLRQIYSRKIGAWLTYARRNGTAGRSKQSIRHVYAHALKLLGYDCCKLKI